MHIKVHFSPQRYLRFFHKFYSRIESIIYFQQSECHRRLISETGPCFANYILPIASDSMRRPFSKPRSRLWSGTEITRFCMFQLYLSGNLNFRTKGSGHLTHLFLELKYAFRKIDGNSASMYQKIYPKFIQNELKWVVFC